MKWSKKNYQCVFFQLIPENNDTNATKNVQNSQILFLKTKINFFKNSFLADVIELNNIDADPMT